MINYQNGKRIATFGFACQLLAVIVCVGTNLLSSIFLSKFNFYAFFTMVANVALLIAAIGFAIMWLDRRNLADLIVSAACVIGVIAYAINIFRTLSNVGTLADTTFLSAFSLLGGLSPILLLALAFRIKDRNRLIAFALCAAFVFRFLWEMIFSRLIPTVAPSMVISLISGIISIGISALCLFSVLQKTDL